MPPDEREQTLWGALLFFGKAWAFRARRALADRGPDRPIQGSVKPAVANARIVAHSRILPGSMAEAGRDATIFWNYVDLRFRPPVRSQLEVFLTRNELIVRLRALQAVPALQPVRPAAPPLKIPARSTVESCETCGV